MSVAQVVQCVRESSYGTKMASPVAGTDSIYVLLPESDSFNAVATPVPFMTPYGGGFDIPADLSIDHHNATGKLQTLLYPDQVNFWLGLALTRINTAQTSPFTTTEPPGDLASFTLYHAVKTRTGSWKRFRFAGAKVKTLAIAVSRQDPRAKLSVDLVFQKQAGHAVGATADPDATEFPLPAESAYPSGPYLLSETSGEFKRAGTALSHYQSLTLTVNNVLDPLPFEDPWLKTCGAHGRNTTLDATLLYKTTPDQLADLQAGTARAFVLKFTKGTKVLTIDLLGNNHISEAGFSLGLGKEYLQNIKIQNKWDRSANAGAGGDIQYTYVAS